MVGYLRKIIAIGMALMLVVVLIPTAYAADGPRTGTMPPPPSGEVPGELIVTFKDGTSPSEASETISEQQGRQEGEMRSGAVRLVQVEPRKTDKAVGELRSDPDVARVEKNPVVSALTFPADGTPNDTYYSYQWDMPQINTKDAWKKASGSGVKVAVIDTGVAFENYSDSQGSYIIMPDLAGTRFSSGYDFVNNDTHANDDHGHGTHVTGTIAQTTNNARSEAGIAYDATIMPVKVLSASGSGSSFGVAQGIRWATDQGADVINMSLGSSYDSSTMADAVSYAVSNGVLVVAAAGNSGTSAPLYPAAYPGVTSVGAVRYDKTRSGYSTYGSTLDIVAPGGDTGVDQNGDGYGDGVLQQTFSGAPSNYGDYFFQGTSMATPHVAGVAALLMSAGVTDPDRVAEVLRKSAVDRGAAGRDDYYGYGLLNADRALDYASAPSAIVASPANDATVTDQPITISGTAADGGSVNSGVAQTQVQIRRSSDGQYWNGSTWQTAAVWSAAGITSGANTPSADWQYSLADTLSDETLAVQARARDRVGVYGPASTAVSFNTGTLGPRSELSAPGYSTEISKTTVVPLRWSAAEADGATVSSYDVQFMDRNAVSPIWKTWRTGLTSTSVDFPVRAGHAYYFRVRARDSLGNYGAWSANKQTIVPYNEKSASSTSGFAGAYSNTTSNYYLNTMRYSRRAGEWMSFTTTAKSLSVIGSGGAHRSRAKVYVDGAYRATIDPYRQPGYRKTLYSVTWSASGRHTIKVVNLATPGRSQFDIDGFGAGR